MPNRVTYMKRLTDTDRGVYKAPSSFSLPAKKEKMEFLEKCSKADAIACLESKHASQEHPEFTAL
jgi:hypothetical protein